MDPFDRRLAGRAGATTSSSTPRTTARSATPLTGLHAEQGHDLDARIAFDAPLTPVVSKPRRTRLHVFEATAVPTVALLGGYATSRAVVPEPRRRRRAPRVRLGQSWRLRSDLARQARDVAVLGMLTTKNTARGREADRNTTRGATKYKSLDDLALSTQCGFASAANAPMTAKTAFQARPRRQRRAPHLGLTTASALGHLG